MTNEQIELLGFILDSGDDGVHAEEVSENFDISESTAYKRLVILRKHELAQRIRDDDNSLVHIITSKGKEIVGDNPKVIKSNKQQEVFEMVLSVKVSDDLVEELESLMEEEELDSYTQAVDFALADYFGLVEEETEESAEESGR